MEFYNPFMEKTNIVFAIRESSSEYIMWVKALRFIHCKNINTHRVKTTAWVFSVLDENYFEDS